MILNTVTIERLESSNRWNAEFFIDIDNKIEHSKNYNVKKLSELVKERKEFLLPNDYSDRYFNYIGLENISQNTRSLVGFSPKLGSNIKSRCKVFREGDILYGRLRPTLNKTLLITDQVAEGICSTEIFVLTPNTELIEPNYLVEILISKLVLDRVGSITAGAALPRMQIKDFLNLDIPVLPLAQQKALAKSALKARKVAEEKLLLAHHTFSQLPNAFIDSIESGGESISLTAANTISENFENPLPQGDFLAKRGKKA